MPPLSPIKTAMQKGQVQTDGLFPKFDQLRIPIKYLANMLTAGEERPVENALQIMILLREFMRKKTVEGVTDLEMLEQHGVTEHMMEDMYRIIAIANYEDRFVIPTNHREYAGKTPFDNEIAAANKGSCGFSFGNGCQGGAGDSLKLNIFDTSKRHNTMSGNVHGQGSNELAELDEGE
jgi:nitrate reductase beta subunit